MAFSDRLEKLRQEKNRLIENRLLEVARLAQKTDTLALDNDLILGALLYTKEAQEKQNIEVLEDLKNRAMKFPSRKKSLSKKNKTAK